MKFFYFKKDSGLSPYDDEAREGFKKFTPGDVLSIEVKRVRNYNHHKTMFRLINLVLENTDRFSNKTQVLDYLKFKVGEYTTRIIDQTVITELNSISFDSMDQDHFNVFFSDSINVILTDLLPGNTREEIVNEVLRHG
jgi:hypothetical protein